VLQEFQWQFNGMISYHHRRVAHYFDFTKLRKRRRKEGKQKVVIGKGKGHSCLKLFRFVFMVPTTHVSFLGILKRKLKNG